MTKGFVNVSFAKSVVVIETGHLDGIQYGLLRGVLHGSVSPFQVRELAHRRIEVSWAAGLSTESRRRFSRDKPMTPERLREAIFQALEPHAAELGIEVTH